MRLTIRSEEPIKVKISELFAPTLQGEGRSQGKPAAFVRFSLCNLDCRWCDTPYTWDWKGKNGIAFDPEKESTNVPVDQIIEWGSQFNRIVISGGEPFVQRKPLDALTQGLIEEDCLVEVETNGTFSPEGMADGIMFTVSPKITNSGVSWNKAIKRNVLEEFVARDAQFKFVVKDAEDLREIIQLKEELSIPRSSMWLMPEGRTREEILTRLPWLFDVCSDLRFNLSARLHVLAHNDKRGV